MFPPLVKPLGSICEMVFVAPTRYARRASERELAVLGNMPPAPFCRSVDAELAPATELTDEAAELGMPAASLDAGVDSRLAHDLGF